MPQTAASLHLGLSTAVIPGGPDKPLRILLPKKAELQLGLIFLVNCSDVDLLFSFCWIFPNGSSD